MIIYKVNEFLDAHPPIEIVKTELIREIEKDRRNYVTRANGSDNLYDLGTVIGKTINKNISDGDELSKFMAGIKRGITLSRTEL